MLRAFGRLPGCHLLCIMLCPCCHCARCCCCCSGRKNAIYREQVRSGGRDSIDVFSNSPNPTHPIRTDVMMVEESYGRVCCLKAGNSSSSGEPAGQSNVDLVCTCLQVFFFFPNLFCSLCFAPPFARSIYQSSLLYLTQCWKCVPAPVYSSLPCTIGSRGGGVALVPALLVSARIGKVCVWRYHHWCVIVSFVSRFLSILIMKNHFF